MTDAAAVASRVEELVEQPLERLGFHLVDVEYRYEGRWILRLLVEREGGVSLDDCAKASEVAGAMLDEHDPVPHEYALEVSSPGLFRQLRRPKHYRQSLGKTVRLKLAGGHLPEETQRVLRGTIAEADAEGVVLDVDGRRVPLPFEAIRSAKLDPEL